MKVLKYLIKYINIMFRCLIILLTDEIIIFQLLIVVNYKER